MTAGWNFCRPLTDMRESLKLFPYYGTKFRLAPIYPRAVHDIVVEPFAGAAGYSCRFYDRRVILNEKDPLIFGILDYLVKASPQEIMALPIITNDTVDDHQIPQEAKWLIGFWLNAAAARPAKRVYKGWGSSWDATARARLAWAVRQIKHWKVYNGSYDELPTKREATWFVDPPYQKMGELYKHSAKGIDFPALGAWCQKLPGQVIVCENTGADWLPFKPFRMEQGQRAKADQMEVVWLKGCPKVGFGLV